MLRIHFSPDDVGRVRIAGEPDPMWETVFSIFRVRQPGPSLSFGPWQRYAASRARPGDLDMLMPLVRNVYYPDFLTPFEGAGGLEAGLEALLSTPRERLRAEAAELDRLTDDRLPTWVPDLARGDRATLDRLAAAIRSRYDSVVAPFWPDARAQLDADRSRRARILVEQGVEGLLRSFAPMMRWQPPVLEVDVRPEQTLHLDGRGLLLVPSYLSWRTPDFLKDTELPPVLVYPVERDLTLRTGPGGPSVAELIGQTRTSVLESIGDGRTTTELARRVGVSPAAVSQHTAVLREARLIHTTRIGKAVLHTITPLGEALLDGRPARG